MTPNNILPTPCVIAVITLVAVGLGLALLLEPGTSLLIVLAVLPFILVIFCVPGQWKRHARQCLERYVRFKKQYVAHKQYIRSKKQ